MATISSQKHQRRAYVSESRKDNAQVTVDTAIRPEQKAFFAETGKLPENQAIRGTSADTAAVTGPMAGESPCVVLGKQHCLTDDFT